MSRKLVPKHGAPTKLLLWISPIPHEKVVQSCNSLLFSPAAGTEKNLRKNKHPYEGPPALKTWDRFRRYTTLVTRIFHAVRALSTTVSMCKGDAIPHMKA